MTGDKRLSPTQLEGHIRRQWSGQLEDVARGSGTRIGTFSINPMKEGLFLWVPTKSVPHNLLLRWDRDWTEESVDDLMQKFIEEALT